MISLQENMCWVYIYDIDPSHESQEEYVLSESLWRHNLSSHLKISIYNLNTSVFAMEQYSTTRRIVKLFLCVAVVQQQLIHTNQLSPHQWGTPCEYPLA